MEWITVNKQHKSKFLSLRLTLWLRCFFTIDQLFQSFGDRIKFNFKLFVKLKILFIFALTTGYLLFIIWINVTFTFIKLFRFWNFFQACHSLWCTGFYLLSILLTGKDIFYCSNWYFLLWDNLNFIRTWESRRQDENETHTYDN